VLQRDAVVDGRYQVMGTLGSGAAGTVYLVSVVNQPGRNLALKEMQAAGAEADQHRQFETEASAWMAARHRSLATVHDFFLAGDVAYLLMDYIPGRTLWDTLLSMPAAPQWEVVAAWLRVFTDALRFLHGRPQPLVLRELEPSNCILQPDGELKLVSFGLARIFTAPEPNPFSAPEEQGDASNDPRADIYSLGATLYVMMSRHLPPESWERLAGLTRLPAAPDVPPLIMKVIDKMMAVLPQDRFQSVAEALTALQIALAPPKLTAGPETPAVRAPLLPRFVPGGVARPTSSAAPAEAEEEDVDEVASLTEYLREVVAEYEKKVSNIGRNGLTAPMLLYYRDEVQDTLDSLEELKIDIQVWWEHVVGLDEVVRERAQDVVDEVGWSNFKQYWIMNDPPRARWWWYLSRQVSAPPPVPRFWEVWKKKPPPGRLP
jgi:serine/threonine protein kinase